MRRALILPSARRGFLTLTWVNYGGHRVPGQPFGIGLAVAHFKFHTAGRAWARPGIVRAERPERKRPLLPALDAAAGAVRSVKDSGLP